MRHPLTAQSGETVATPSVDPDVVLAVRRAAVRATLAPSVHNTQPWRLRLCGGDLEIRADWNRRLRVLDPRGRQLMISCGGAVFNARVSLAAAGYETVVDRFPDSAQPDLVARLTVAGCRADKDPIGALDSAVEARRTNRRRFADEPMPADIVVLLVEAANNEGAFLLPITRPEHRLATARLSQQADFVENVDVAYRAELRAWTSGDPHRLDGVPAMAVPRRGDGLPGELPTRDFDTEGLGWLPSEARSTSNQCLLLLGSRQDTPVAWLRAGEALERVLLEITRQGYAASPLTQVIEVAATNALLRQELELTMHPHVLLRVGRAPTTPASRRRRLVDMLEESR